jgi:hypothetical protein
VPPFPSLALSSLISSLSSRELSPWHVTARRHVLTHTPFNSFDHVICLLVKLLLISSSVVECEEFVPAMLRLMEARNEDARFQGCAECLVWLCLVSLSFRPRCLVSLSCQDILFLISFLVATSRCLLLCLPLAVLSTALSESAVPWLLLLCWSLFSVVSYSCLVCRHLSCLFA